MNDLAELINVSMISAYDAFRRLMRLSSNSVPVLRMYASFLIDLANIKEVRGFSQDGRHVKFNPAKPTVVMRVGDRFSEYDLTGNPVANDELPTTPEARTKR
jgi:hypothetical protein